MLLGMGRRRAFEEDEVLARAMDVFWLNGFNGTSMDLIVAEVGIGKQSLYNTFGDKHALFLRALDFYSDELVRQWLSPLVKPEAALPELQAFLRRMCLGLSKQPSRACFMINTTLELAVHDEQVSDRASRYLDRLEAAFINALRNARKNDQIQNPATDRALARHLSASFLSLNVFAKAGRSKAALNDVVNTALASL